MKNPFQKNTPAQESAEQPLTFTERSQASHHRERGLRVDLDKVERAITETKSSIEKLEAEQEHMAAAIAIHGKDYYKSRLEYVTDRLGRERQLIPILEKKREAIIAEIEGLKLSAEQSRARLEQQQQFAQLATDRLGKDREIDGLIKELCQKLLERNKLTADMREGGEALELTLAFDALDSDRFEKLLSALPDDVFDRSDSWQAWFLGKRAYAKPYVVVASHFTAHRNLGALRFLFPWRADLVE